MNILYMSIRNKSLKISSANIKASTRLKSFTEPDSSASSTSSTESDSDKIIAVNFEPILTISINGHGIENDEPFPESNNIKNFYKTKVRVFSEARVPNVGCISPFLEKTYINQATSRMRVYPNAETKTILEDYMDAFREPYKNTIRADKVSHLLSNSDTRITTLRTIKQKYKKKVWDRMVYLSNKVFNYKDFGGIFLIDIRWKITYSDNSVQYVPIFTPTQDTIIKLTTIEGLDIFRSIMLPIISTSTRPTFEESIQLMKSNDSAFFVETDLYFLANHLFSYFQYINIIDHSCRVISSRKKITGRKMSYLYDMEKMAEQEMTKFGGKRNNRTTRRKRNSTIKKIADFLLQELAL